MKNNRKYNLSATLPAALAMLSGMMLAGCSAVDTDDIGMTEDGRVPIEFTLSGNSLSAEADDPTRAGEVTTCNVSFLGWEHTGTTPGTAAPTWVDAINGVTTTSKVYSFSPKRYYVSSKNTSIIGFYPPVVIGSTHTAPALYNTSQSLVVNTTDANGGLILDPADGSIDVLASTILTGSGTSKIGNVAMKHLTSQIALQVKAKDGEYNDVKSLNITKITLKGTSVPSVLSHEGKIRKSNENKDITVFTGSTAIPQSATNIGNPAFLTPGTTIPQIEVTAGTSTATIPINGITSLVAGNKYVITIIVAKEGFEPPYVKVVSAITGGNDYEVLWTDNGDYTVNF